MECLIDIIICKLSSVNGYVTDNISILIISAISLTVYVGIRNLEFSIDLPNHLRSKSLGLLGNFDGISTNDFSDTNGDMIQNNSVNSERNILENFASLCE